MTVLSDRDIMRLLRNRRLVIENFEEKNLTPNGYDVTIDEILYKEKTMKKGEVEIVPGAWFALSTREYFGFGPELAGQIWLRTSWIRKGLIASFGRIDAGFEGNLTFAALNASKNPVKISVGDGFAQVVFESLSSRPLKTYAERSGRYQSQRGIVLEPEKENKGNRK